jgi:hypothetical protein
MHLFGHSIEIECPNCKFYTRIVFLEVILRDVVICRGCKFTLRLDDHMNECRLAMKKTDEALAVFASSLKSTFS